MRFPLSEHIIGGYKFGVPTYYSSFHQGCDYRAATGTPLYAPEEGITQLSQTSTTWGKFIEYKGSSGYTYIFAHLKEQKVGKLVHCTEGQLIGICDNTGESKAAHLHLELRDPSGRLIDPEPFFKNTMFNEKLIRHQDTGQLAYVLDDTKREIKGDRLQQALFTLIQRTNGQLSGSIVNVAKEIWDKLGKGPDF